MVRCKTHPVHSFTLYPAGHFPYGRVAVARCSVAGPVLLDAETQEPVWDDTVFEAAERAASGVCWPAHSTAVEPATRRTQGRRLELAGLLLGVHPELDDGERERIATRLGVSTMTLRSAAAQWAESWTQRGAAVTQVLAMVWMGGSLLDRLLSAGYAAGLWTQPRRWAPPRQWVVARSDEPERRPEGLAGGGPPPSTNSRGVPGSGPDPPSPPP